MGKKLTPDDLWGVLSFLSRVVPRGPEEADRLHELITKIEQSLTSRHTRQ